MPGLHEAFERIGSFLEGRLPLMHAPGAALAVTDGGEILGVVVRGFADAASGTPVRPETRFQIGSIGKSFAAIVALQEVECGRLDLHAPVGDLLPWLELRQPYGPITMHHLLTHSSGLPTGTDDSAEATFAAWRLRDVEPGFAPGERFHYSNYGYKLVGLVLEHMTRRSIRDLLAERILQPLGMASTTPSITADERRDLATGYRTIYDDRPPQREHPLVPAQWIDTTSADGSIVSNVIDMSAYARMLLARGAGPASRLLSEGSFALMTGRNIEDQDDPGWFYGYGLWTGHADGHNHIEHSGGMVGYTAYLSLDPDGGLGAIMCLNGSGEKAPAVGFALDAVRAALAGEALPDLAPAPDPLRIPDAAAFAGHYRGAERDIEVIAEGQGLRLRDGSIDVALELDLSDKPQDAFLVPHSERDRYYLRFGRDASGAVVEASHGPDWFAGRRYDGPAEFAPPPREWGGLVGHYRNYNPWMPGFRVVLRRGSLVFITSWVDEDLDLELVPLPDGSFRVGTEDWRPGRIRFDTIVEGRALRAHYDDGTWYRSFEQ